MQRAVAEHKGPKVSNRDISRAASKLWSESHEKEKKFNLGKERIRRTFAFLFVSVLVCFLHGGFLGVCP